MHCSTCGDERWFEQPPCEDGHGADCPERACANCGAAVIVADVPARPADFPPPTPRPTVLAGA